VAEGVDEILGLVAKCPKCGEPAVSAYVTRKGYIYAWHVARDGKKHAWYIGPARGPWLKILDCLRRKELVLSDEDREALCKVHAEKMCFDEKERERVKEIIDALLKARKVVVYGGPA